MLEKIGVSGQLVDENIIQRNIELIGNFMQHINQENKQKEKEELKQKT